MKDYDVTVSRVGNITIKANSSQEAAKMVSDLSAGQLEKLASFCDYEVTDVTEQPEPVYYYCLFREKSNDKRFFRTDKKMVDTSDIIDYAVSANIILRSRKHLYCAESVEETEYRERIVSQLRVHFENERSDYHKELKKLPVDNVISSADKIQFYDDIIYLLDDRSNDDDFSLKEVERLLDTEKPLEQLYKKNYIKIDFSDVNERMIGIINTEV